MIGRALVVSLLIGGLAADASADATAQRRLAAKARFEKGLRLYDEGRYQDALLAYQSAYEVFRSVSVLLNLGITKEKVNDFEGCFLTLSQFLREVPANDPDRGKANSVAERCHRQSKMPVKVTSLPAGAAVVIDGSTRGRTPAHLELPAGSYSLALELPGYMRQEQPLRVEEGVHPDLDFVMEKLSTLAIESDVTGATVELDGHAEGTAPIKREIQAGVHRVRLTHAGYRQVEREARVTPGEQVSLMFSLPLLPRERTLSLALDRPGATTEVAIDGYKVGTAPLERRVTSGAHRLEISALGYKAFDGEVTVPEDRDLRLQARLSPRRSRRAWTIFGVLVGTTAVTAVIGGGYGIAALTTKSSFDAHPTEALARQGHTDAVVSDTLLGVAAAGAIASVLYFVLTIPKPSRVTPVLERPLP